MRARIASFALAAAAAVAAVPGTAQAAAVRHQCSGTYDTNCYTWVCSRNCLEVNCAVWIDVVPTTQSGCIG